MADLSEIFETLKAEMIASVYPNGPVAGSSTVGTDVTFGIGWPNETELNRLLTAQQSLISIYPLDGERNTTQWEYAEQEVERNAPGISVVADSTCCVYTLSGVAGTDEALGVSFGAVAYKVSLVAGMTASAVASGVAAALPVGTATARGNTLTFAVPTVVVAGNDGYSMLNVGEITRRVQIIVYSFDQNTRDKLFKQLVQLISSTNFLTVTQVNNADGEAVNIKYDGSTWSDKLQNAGGYQRSLIVLVTYQTTVYERAYAIFFAGALVENVSLNNSVMIGPTSATGVSANA